MKRTDLIEMWGYFMGREYAHRYQNHKNHCQYNLFSFYLPIKISFSGRTNQADYR